MQTAFPDFIACYVCSCANIACGFSNSRTFFKPTVLTVALLVHCCVRRRPSSVCLSSVTLCIVAERCVLEQKLLLRAYRKSYMRNLLVPNLLPKWIILIFVSRS